MSNNVEDLINLLESNTASFREYSEYFRYASILYDSTRIDRHDVNILRKHLRLIYLNRHHPVTQ